MPGRKYGIIVTAKTPASYHGLSQAEQAKAGKAMEQALKTYAGKVDLLRHYWTSISSGEISDVIVMESNDPADLHGFQDELERLLLQGRRRRLVEVRQDGQRHLRHQPGRGNTEEARARQALTPVAALDSAEEDRRSG